MTYTYIKLKYLIEKRKTKNKKHYQNYKNKFTEIVLMVKKKIFRE
jgi:hypothetical protein